VAQKIKLVTQTVFGGLSILIYPPVGNFLYSVICTKNYESWLAVDKLIAMLHCRLI